MAEARVEQYAMNRVFERAREFYGDVMARLTRFGRFLRSTSLDELPELVNVVRGDMSLVGPRPLLVQYLDRYTDEQARRHDVRPGITGWAQVRYGYANGLDEETEKRRLELAILTPGMPA